MAIIRQLERSGCQRLMQATLLSGGFLLLLGEIRFEHRAVLEDDWRAWIPIVYCTTMVLIVPCGIVTENRRARLVLGCAYILTVIIGMLGAIFHSDGHMLDRVSDLIHVWTSSVPVGGSLSSKHPPLLAPLAFAGLGTVGLLLLSLDKTKSKIDEESLE